MTIDVLILFLVFLIAGAFVVDHILKKLSPPTFDEAKASQLAKTARWTEEARRKASAPLISIPMRSVYLGKYITSTTNGFLPDSGVWVSGNQVSLDLSIFGGHIAIFGSTGYGKTELEKRLLYELFSKTDLNIHLYDGKGNEDLTRAFCSMAYMFGRGNAKVFRMGQQRKGYPYNAFTGSPEAIKEKLIALSDIPSLEKNGLWYGKMKRMVINAICDAPGGPPRSLDEFMFRVTDKWFSDTYGSSSPYRKDQATQQRVSLMMKNVGSNPSPIDNVALDFYAIKDELGPYLADDGLSLESDRAINFSVRLSSMPFVGKYFTEFVLSDYLDYAYNRMDRPTVLMIDEQGILPGMNLEHLLAVARQAGLKIIFTTQSFASLGDQLTQERILSNCNTQIFLKLLYPDYASEMSGTTMQPETAYQSENGLHTGMTSTRFQHQFAIPPKELRELPVGQCYLYRDGGNARIAIEAIPPLPEPPPEETYVPTPKPMQPMPAVKHPTP